MTITSVWQAIRASFFTSFGTIVFGMEDGMVSIFGLVFGVAASASTNRMVLLAGATGAATAAIAMMAGTYLDAVSSKGQAKAHIATVKQEIEHNRSAELAKLAPGLAAIGLDDKDRSTIIDILNRYPAFLLEATTAYEQEIVEDDQQSPIIQSLWMLMASLVAAFVPVIPFAFYELATARIISISVTAILLVLLGILRGLVAKSSILRAAVETLAIATAAALTGYFIGKLVTL
jgi:VIT1/CCC1 family predicted Fe2+/Mn2+ transporter